MKNEPAILKEKCLSCDIYFVSRDSFLKSYSEKIKFVVIRNLLYINTKLRN